MVRVSVRRGGWGRREAGGGGGGWGRLRRRAVEGTSLRARGEAAGRPPGPAPRAPAGARKIPGLCCKPWRTACTGSEGAGRRGEGVDSVISRRAQRAVLETGV